MRRERGQQWKRRAEDKLGEAAGPEGEKQLEGKGDPEEMRGEENEGGVVNWLLFSLLRQNAQQKQLKEGKGHSGSQFEGYSLSWWVGEGEGTAAREGGCWSPCSHSQEEERRVLFRSISHFDSAQDSRDGAVHT